MWPLTASAGDHVALLFTVSKKEFCIAAVVVEAVAASGWPARCRFSEAVGVAVFEPWSSGQTGHDLWDDRLVEVQRRTPGGRRHGYQRHAREVADQTRQRRAEVLAEESTKAQVDR